MRREERRRDRVDRVDRRRAGEGDRRDEPPVVGLGDHVPDFLTRGFRLATSD